MKVKFVFPILAVLYSTCAITSISQDSQPPAGKIIEKLTGDDVLKRVRYSYTLFDREFDGQLRFGLVKKIPFRLTLKPESVRFSFQSPSQIIHLDTKNQGFSLSESFAGGEFKPVAPDYFGKKIRGADVTYDDLSMRFLYWPNASILKEEKYKTLDTWLVRVSNPNGQGPYSMVDCRIDRSSGGLIKMVGYNHKKRAVCRMEVLHGKKFEDVWMVSEMRIESLSAVSGKVLSSTRLQIKKLVEH